MRSKIDLTGHKLAGVYRPPPRRTHWKRYKPNKLPDRTFRQIVRLVDGAVRDTFEHHPEYLTAKGRMSAAHSITKRVSGTLWGYAIDITEEKASQRKAARGRPEAEADAPLASAATQSGALLGVSLTSRLFSKARGIVRRCKDAGRGGRGSSPASADKFWWWPR